MKITNLDIELTQRCNLACPYCYLGQMKAKGTITNELLDKCLDLIAKFGVPKQTEKESPTRINFYGGEPLLAFDKIQYLVEASRKRGFGLTFLAVSNGTIASPRIIDYCKKNKITVQRSLDGCPEAMELCRGKDTLEKYNKATPLWGDYEKTRRSTVLPETAKYLLEDLRYFEKLGFKKGFSPMPDYYSEWSPEHIQDYKNNLWKLGDEFVKDYRKGKIFYLYWFEKEFMRFNAMKRSYKPSQGCAAGMGLHCVSWTGYVYLCHRFTNESTDNPFCAGHIDELLNGTAKGYDPTIMAQIRNVKRGKRHKRCETCIANLTCSQCCYHSNYKCMGDVTVPPPLFCELKQETSKVVTAIDNNLRQTNGNWWKKCIRKVIPPHAPPQEQKKAQPRQQKPSGGNH